MQYYEDGISASTIRHAMTEGPMIKSPDVPLDPSDFKRCVDMLDSAPDGWRNRLHEVSIRCPVYFPMVQKWSELENLLRKGKIEKLYELMKECRKKASDNNLGRKPDKESLNYILDKLVEDDTVK